MTRRRLSFYTGAAVTSDHFATLATFDGRNDSEEDSGNFSFDLFDRRMGTWRHVTAGKDVVPPESASGLSSSRDRSR